MRATAVYLAHASIRTENLNFSQQFYCDVLGLRVGYRPPFEFPGIWLYDDSDRAVVHLIGSKAGGSTALDAYLGARRRGSRDTGAFDHVAFAARDWRKIKARCDASGIAYEQRVVPELEQHQVFLRDPAGIVVELIFPGCESDPRP